MPVAPRRGAILDANHRVMAQTLVVHDLRIDGQLAYADPSSIHRLCDALGLDPQEVWARLTPTNRYSLLLSDLNEEHSALIASLKLRPARLIPRMRRAYPQTYQASHVVGWVNRAEITTDIDGKSIEIETGAGGIERVMESYLRGIPGERRVIKDATRRSIPAFETDIPARPGFNVVLTLDTGIQHIVEQEAARLWDEFRPEALHIIVLRPGTGEILALCNRPTFDPNSRETMTPRNLRNGAIMDSYEPGSTFKLITTAAVLNERMADLNTPVFCENGKFFYAGHTLHDVSPHGMLTVTEALAKSSNIAFAKLALVLGPERLHRYIRLFGFGHPPPPPALALPGEQRGILRPADRWSNVSITRVPIGYEIAATNLQMTLAVGAIANGGNLMEPRLVKGIVDAEGRAIKQFLPRVVRPVIDRDTSWRLRQAMRHAVSADGTALKAAVPGFSVGGKTGTARKWVNGQYSTKEFRSSFIGFLPAFAPEVVISILVDEPKGQTYYGGSVAAPAFRNIGSKVAAHLGLQPDEPRTTLAQGGQP
ncbi:MAG: penicillin-binding transpeptidase domain-containing protein [Verrucomicrobiia bacterium]